MNYEEKAEVSQFTPTDDEKEQRCKKYIYTNERKMGNYTTLQKKRKNKKHESIVHFTDRVTCSVAEYKDFMIYHRD